MRKYFLILFYCLLFLPIVSYAQTSAVDSLLQTMNNDTDIIGLLPTSMPGYKRVFWGENGWMRRKGFAPLTMENREKEIEARRKMLRTHQTMGYITSALMVATMITGDRTHEAKLANGSIGRRDDPAKKLHSVTVGVMGASYVATGVLSILSPPPLIIRKDKGFSNIKVHRALAVVHLSGMFINGVFAEALAEDHNAFHRAVGYVTAGSLLGAMIVMKF